jgi:hypothetical protein
MKKLLMRMLVGVLLCAGITAAVVGRAGARPAAAAGDDSTVLQADQAFVAAIRTTDKASLGQLLDAGFSWTDVDGRTLTRAAVLQELPKPLTNGGGSAPITTHVYGDVALVRTDDGLAHVLRVWVKRPAGWKAMVYQEVRSLAAPPTVTPGPGIECENPCRNVLYQPKNEAERGVITSYMGLETASVGHDAPNWGPHVADEFVAASSYSNKLLTKTARMADLAKSEMAGLAPTPVVTMSLVDFGDTVVMLSKQRPDKGKPLHITRVWTKRDGKWVIVIAFQTAIQAESGRS